MKKNYLLLLIFCFGCTGASSPNPTQNIFGGTEASLSETPLPKTISPDETLAISNKIMEDPFHTEGFSKKEMVESFDTTNNLALQLSPLFIIAKATDEQSNGTTEENATGVHCNKNKADRTLKCEGEIKGPLGGTAFIRISLTLSKSSDTTISGKMKEGVQLNSYTFTNACDKIIKANGMFDCDLDLTIDVDSKRNLFYSFQGQCHTANSDQNVLDVEIENKNHKIGYDLALEDAVTLQPGEQKNIPLKNMNVHGTVFVDGTSYSYEELQLSANKGCQ